MSIWASIIDAIADAAEGERRYRRENPCEWAQVLRQRAAMWKRKGRDGLARVAMRRAERWEAKCIKKRT